MGDLGWLPGVDAPLQGGMMAAAKSGEYGHEDIGTERRRALAEIERDCPPWHARPGVLAGVLYARLPRASGMACSSPPGPPPNCA